ncbi:hypothetical protein FB451DRAFT_1565899, partial [Mycena latifolia]
MFYFNSWSTLALRPNADHASHALSSSPLACCAARALHQHLRLWRRGEGHPIPVRHLNSRALRPSVVVTAPIGGLGMYVLRLLVSKYCA